MELDDLLKDGALQLVGIRSRRSAGCGRVVHWHLPSFAGATVSLCG
ncbi:MAG TPA: hypothetical protein VGO80_19650 [Solirubrobacteraceae bacterium]|jgi:hypothetical protein|nr:hypothetical protein [Solirubrobacteraceae bacterium]